MSRFPREKNGKTDQPKGPQLGKMVSKIWGLGSQQSRVSDEVTMSPELVLQQMYTGLYCPRISMAGLRTNLN